MKTRRKKQFCKRGHDVFIVGRNKRHRCKACWKIEHPLKRGHQPVKFCEEGHDRSKFGIEKGSRCGKCRSTELRLNNLKRKYGITIEFYDKMFNEQRGKCAICSNTGKLVVDHNHKTNEIRALLCINCNWLLGQCKESFEILEKAMRYLKFYETPKNKGA